MSMFCKNQKVQRAGDVILGFGILFMGLKVMGESLTIVKQSPVVKEFLSSLSSPFIAILVGFIATSVLQSSSATVGIIILMASQNLIQFMICPFVILGCNIGSCVSALLASLNGRKDAKRAAMIHFLFNVYCDLYIYQTDHRCTAWNFRWKCGTCGCQYTFSDENHRSGYVVPVYGLDREADLQSSSGK